MAWFSHITDSATSGDVLVDPGAFGSTGGRVFRVGVNGVMAAVVRIEWRNSDNTGTIQQQTISVPADTYVEFMGAPMGAEAEFQVGQRLRLVAGKNISSAVGCSLFVNTD